MNQQVTQAKNSPLLDASCSKLLSTSFLFIWKYLTLEALRNILFTEDKWGYLSTFKHTTLSSFKFKYWSTVFNVPLISTPFFNYLLLECCWLVQTHYYYSLQQLSIHIVSLPAFFFQVFSTALKWAIARCKQLF